MANEQKSSPINRRQFIRTRVPAAERVASAVIVMLLLGIGITIAIKGKHFDPNLYAVRTDSLKSTAAAVEGKGGTARSAPEPRRFPPKPQKRSLPKKLHPKVALNIPATRQNRRRKASRSRFP